MFSQEEKQKIADALNSKLRTHNAVLRCPMCQHEQFTMAEAYLRNDLQPDIKNINIGGPAIPAIAIICTNCGFISQHAIGALGLLPKMEKKSE